MTQFLPLHFPSHLDDVSRYHAQAVPLGAKRLTTRWKPRVNAREIPSNPTMSEQINAAPDDFHHYAVVLTFLDRPGSIAFYATKLITDLGPPDPAECLALLATEAALIEQADWNYQVWCPLANIEPDDPLARRQWESIIAQTMNCKAVLGGQDYRELLAIV